MGQIFVDRSSLILLERRWVVISDILRYGGCRCWWLLDHATCSRWNAIAVYSLGIQLYCRVNDIRTIIPWTSEAVDHITVNSSVLLIPGAFDRHRLFSCRVFVFSLLWYGVGSLKSFFFPSLDDWLNILSVEKKVVVVALRDRRVSDL